MDKNTLIFERLASLLECFPLPAIPYIGRAESDRGGQWYNPPASHVEIVYVSKGRYENFRVGEEPFDLKEGHVSFHNVHFGNYSDFTKGVESWCVVFDVTGISDFSDLLTAPFFSSSSVEHAQRVKEAFEWATVRCNTVGSTTYFGGPVVYDPSDVKEASLKKRLGVKAAILQLLWVIIDELPPLSGDVNPGNISHVKNVQQFIAANFCREQLGLEDLAASANVSSNYLGHLFQRYLHTTPMRYLKQYRINQASMLLRRTRRPIGEIALHVGFSDALHFSREFKLQMGRCPREFRRSSSQKWSMVSEGGRVDE